MRENIVFEYPGKSHDFTFLRRAVLGRLGAAAGYGVEIVDRAMAVFNLARNDVEVFPEVRPALTALGEHYCVIAVTNGNASLDQIGIGDLFDHVISASGVGVAKPDRQIFDVAVEAGGADAHETLHVGDHPEVDVVGARNAGLQSVWVNRHGSDWPDHLQDPDAIVKGHRRIAVAAWDEAGMIELPLILYVPGLLPKPEPGPHRDVLFRCLIAGIRRHDEKVALDIAANLHCFDVISWTYDFYKTHRDIALDQAAIEAVIRQDSASKEDIVEAASWQRRVARWAFSVAERYALSDSAHC